MPAGVKLIDPQENEFLAQLEARAKQPNLFFRAMAHRADVLKSFPAFYAAVVGPGTVSRRIKVLVYLACSFANRCPYCIAGNLPGARKAGITEAEIAAVEAERDEAFAPEEQAALRYARELTRTANATATRETLRAHFSDEQMVEITLVAGLSNFTNRFNNGLSILPESAQAD
jgi:uncharacterized peroxidase-related enzyme